MLWTVRGTVGYGGFYGRTVGFTVALRCGYRTVGLGWGRAFGAEATAGWVGEQRCRPHLKIEMGGTRVRCAAGEERESANTEILRCAQNDGS